MKSDYDITIMRTRTCANASNLFKKILRFLLKLPKTHQSTKLFHDIKYDIEEFIRLQRKASMSTRYRHYEWEEE